MSATAANGQQSIWPVYCLLCRHCGKVDRAVYALPPRVRQCKSCERDMIACLCIATHIVAGLRWSEHLTSGAAVSATVLVK
jgi:hypothetical protein